MTPGQQPHPWPDFDGPLNLSQQSETSLTGVQKCVYKTVQPVEKIYAEFIEEHMSLAEHQFTLRR